ncbi:arsenate reductase/protein-tyrosine-phosphatase family protein [Bifidobacterium leontopitheci]|uniref:Protein-tyrosine-phosphatase n=1 Tax=Bifidobacterium leontopitheci TaxID=2650774 RepID=A0A6I1GLH3_9BIFI|nr:hypothetical protein [Bifidobacterium leontopitheci]KAB7790456.1 protein-tyrosine-phosphatase [Bifidobacterium leontopitheci]
MHIVTVCAGNICRSPMAEYLIRHEAGQRHLTDITVSSAGTLRLPERTIDQTCNGLLERHGIDASGFHSTICSRDIIGNADLVLCFTHGLMADILQDNPTAIQRTFLITDFANMCDADVAQGGPEGRTASERLASVIADAPLLRPTLPEADEIADPYHQEQSAYVDAYLAIAQAVERIMAAANPASNAAEPAADATHAFAGSVTFVDIPSLPDIGDDGTAAADADGSPHGRLIPDISLGPDADAQPTAATQSAPAQFMTTSHQPWPTIPTPPQPPHGRHRHTDQDPAPTGLTPADSAFPPNPSEPQVPVIPDLPPLAIPTITLTPQADDSADSQSAANVRGTAKHANDTGTVKKKRTLFW